MSDIAVPGGTDIKLAIRGPYFLVVAAPAPLKADPDAILRPGISGLFTFDEGLSWPNRPGCKYAEGFLQEGVQITLQFLRLVDALTCQQRLRKAAGQ